MDLLLGVLYVAVQVGADGTLRAVIQLDPAGAVRGGELGLSLFKSRDV